MAEKKYYIKSLLNNTTKQNAIEKNLVRLSSIGIKWDESLIRHMRGIGISDNSVSDSFGMPSLADQFANRYNRNLSIAGENDYIAFYDQNYSNRRDFLRKFSKQGEIEFVLSTIADDAIVFDDNNYFAYPNTRQLYAHLDKSKGKEIVDSMNQSFKKVYNAWRFNESNDAWDYFYKFLVDGILAFEIIYKTDPKTNNAVDIIGFQELEPITLQPDIIKDDNGNEYKVWYQNKGDKQQERIIPDSNIIYISWSKANFVQRISYVEHLIRSFNMLRTLENSRVIWNIQNAQKQLKIVVPTGTSNEIKKQQRLSQLRAEFKEDVAIDELSGEITVNGNPKFNFAKTFLFPSDDSGQVEISEIGVGGHDLSNTEQLKFFWRKFILESKLPASRFGALFDQSSGGLPTSDDVQTREEYRYNLFIRRCRNIFKELLIKPTWNLFCLKYPQFNSNTYLKSVLGLNFTEDNIFTLAKLRKIANDGADVINNLISIANPDGTPFFSIKFLTEKYLGLTADDYKLNEKYKKAEAEKFKNVKGAGDGMPPRSSFGGDLGGNDFGGDNNFNDDFGDSDFETSDDFNNEEPDIIDSDVEGFDEPGSAFSSAEDDLA